MKTCENCGKSFQSERSTAKYCSGTCRTQAYLKRKNPSIGVLDNEIIDAEVEYVTEEIPIHVTKHQPNQQYLDIRNHLNNLEVSYNSLERQKLELISKINKKTDYRLILGGLGATGTYLATRGNNIPNKALNALAGGLLGAILGELANNIDSESKQQQVALLKHQLDQIQSQQNLISLEYDYWERQIKSIPEHLSFIDVEYKIIRKPKPKESSSIITDDVSKSVNLDEIINNTTTIQKSTFVNSKEIENMNFNYFELDGDFKWLGKLGEPFHMAVYGKPGQGKSTFCLKFGHYLASKFGNKVLFISKEEGISVSLQDKIKRLNLAHELLIFSKCNPMETDLRGYRFIIIDSVNDAGLSPEDVQVLKENYPKSSFISILQSTKDGNFRGSNAHTHNADIVIKVSEGTAETEKNRFGAKNSYSILFN
jgi:DNA replication protein DnaC